MPPERRHGRADGSGPFGSVARRTAPASGRDVMRDREDGRAAELSDDGMCEPSSDDPLLLRPYGDDCDETLAKTTVPVRHSSPPRSFRSSSVDSLAPARQFRDAFKRSRTRSLDDARTSSATARRLRPAPSFDDPASDITLDSDRTDGTDPLSLSFSGETDSGYKAMEVIKREEDELDAGQADVSEVEVSRRVDTSTGEREESAFNLDFSVQNARLTSSDETRSSGSRDTYDILSGISFANDSALSGRSDGTDGKGMDGDAKVERSGPLLDASQDVGRGQSAGKDQETHGRDDGAQHAAERDLADATRRKDCGGMSEASETAHREIDSHGSTFPGASACSATGEDDGRRITRSETDKERGQTSGDRSEADDDQGNAGDTGNRPDKNGLGEVSRTSLKRLAHAGVIGDEATEDQATESGLALVALSTQTSRIGDAATSSSPARSEFFPPRSPSENEEPPRLQVGRKRLSLQDLITNAVASSLADMLGGSPTAAGEDEADDAARSNVGSLNLTFSAVPSSDIAQSIASASGRPNHATTLPEADGNGSAVKDGVKASAEQTTSLDLSDASSSSPSLLGSPSPRRTKPSNASAKFDRPPIMTRKRSRALDEDAAERPAHLVYQAAVDVEDQELRLPADVSRSSQDSSFDFDVVPGRTAAAAQLSYVKIAPRPVKTRPAGPRAKQRPNATTGAFATKKKPARRIIKLEGDAIVREGPAYVDDPMNEETAALSIARGRLQMEKASTLQFESIARQNSAEQGGTTGQRPGGIKRSRSDNEVNIRAGRRVRINKTRYYDPPPPPMPSLPLSSQRSSSEGDSPRMARSTSNGLRRTQTVLFGKSISAAEAAAPEPIRTRIALSITSSWTSKHSDEPTADAGEKVVVAAASPAEGRVEHAT